MESKPTKVAVLGAGLMGHGIAQVAAQFGGFEVSMLDINQELVDKGMRMIGASLAKFVERGKLTAEQSDSVQRRIKPTTNLAEAVVGSQLVIEAATEDPKLKLELYGKISELADWDTILASNTSSISITLLGSVSRNPANVCGMHFFNPPQLMNLVEIVRGNKTSDATVERARQFSRAMGKETVVCRKDSPGFIVNRVLVPALNEAVFLVQEGVASVEDVDKAIKLGLNWPMGPLQLLDYVGMDTSLSISKVFMDEFQDSKYRPPTLLKEMVRAKKLGRKTGEGFYRWGAPGSTTTKVEST
jgi:3-hydroxybutyryl-CoA dehydrogenase